MWMLCDLPGIKDIPNLPHSSLMSSRMSSYSSSSFSSSADTTCQITPNRLIESAPDTTTNSQFGSSSDRCFHVRYTQYCRLTCVKATTFVGVSSVLERPLPMPGSMLAIKPGGMPDIIPKPPRATALAPLACNANFCIPQSLLLIRQPSEGVNVSKEKKQNKEAENSQNKLSRSRIQWLHVSKYIPKLRMAWKRKSYRIPGLLYDAVPVPTHLLDQALAVHCYQRQPTDKFQSFDPAVELFDDCAFEPSTADVQSLWLYSTISQSNKKKISSEKFSIFRN